MESFVQVSQQILEELHVSLKGIKEEEVRALEDAIIAADRIFVTGEGRSGLIGRCFAMRLMHLGLPTYVVSETMTPAIKQGDLLIAISGAGETQVTCIHARTAAALGANVAVVTYMRNSTLAKASNLLTFIPPGKNSSDFVSVQYGGSLFEQSALILLDTIALRLQGRLEQTIEQIDLRHANLE